MKQQPWIDLTVLLDESFLVYPGDDPIGFSTVRAIEKDEYNLQRLDLNMHMGTHIDAKKHVFAGGESMDEVDVNTFIGRARVIRPEVNQGIISTTSIRQQYSGNERILLLDLGHADKLNTSAYYETPKFEEDIVALLVEKQVQVIGFDLPSPEYAKGHFLNLHKDLLKQNIYIVENLTNLNRLGTVVDYIGLPLKIKGMDGSLVRSVARNIES